MQSSMLSIRSLVTAVLLATTGVGAFAISGMQPVSAEEIIVVAPDAPPPVRYEAVPAARVGYVWDRGHWRWDHGRYVWIGGHWQAERVGYHWMPGHWAQRGPGYRWIAGHWA